MLCCEHFIHGRIGEIIGVQTQTDFSLNLVNFQTIHIFRSKKDVHKPDVDINVEK